MSALIKCSLNGEMNAASFFIKHSLRDHLAADGRTGNELNKKVKFGSFRTNGNQLVCNRSVDVKICIEIQPLSKN